MEYPKIYDLKTTTFQSPPVYIAKEAYDIVIDEVLNGEFTFEMKIPYDFDLVACLPIAGFVKVDDIVFILDSYKLTNSQSGIVYLLKGRHIQYLLTNKFVNNPREYIGQTAYNIINDLLTFSMPDDVPNLSPIRFKPLLAMSGQADLYDIKFENKNVYECIKQLSEIYNADIVCTNTPDTTTIPGNDIFYIGILKPDFSYDLYNSYNGGGKGSAQPTTIYKNKLNILSYDFEIDYTTSVDRLLVRGRNGLEFSGHTITIEPDGITPIPPNKQLTIGPNTSYIYLDNLIDSIINYSQPRGSKLDVTYGYIEFPDVTNKTKLYWAGVFKFLELNKPRISIDLNIIDIQDEITQIQTGDSVYFLDTDIPSFSSVDNNNVLLTYDPISIRLVQYTRYPLEPEKNTMKFSSVPYNMFYVFKDFFKISNTVSKLVDTNGKLILSDTNGADINYSAQTTTDGPVAYNGHVIAGARRNGLRIANSPDTGKNVLFLEDNGATWLLNTGGVGAYIPDNLLGRPQLRLYDADDGYYFKNILVEGDSMIKSIQRGTASLINTNSATINITAVNTAKSIILISGTGIISVDGVISAARSFQGVISSSTQIQITAQLGTGTTATGTVAWQVIEYN